MITCIMKFIKMQKGIEIVQRAEFRSGEKLRKKSTKPHTADKEKKKKMIANA